MPSRPDVPLVLLVLGLAALPLSLAFNPLIWLWLGSTLAIFLYAFYWGLVVRRGMAVRLYRNQALGMSLVSLGSLLTIIGIVIGGFSHAPILTSDSSGVFRIDLYGLLLLFWVDASMRASQDLDPLSRDSLRWSKLRYVLWGLYFAGVGFFLGFLALTGNYEFFRNPPPGVTSTILQLFLPLTLIFPILAGIVVLSIAALRSRDRSFRRQLQWFALALLSLVGLSLLSTIQGLGVLFFESFPVSGYCFYRSTRALVPLSRISSD